MVDYWKNPFILKYMIFLFALGAFASTLLGGLFALKFKDRLHLVLGFSAGAVIGVAFFDLAPETFNLLQPVFPLATITSIMAAGFVAYMILDRYFFSHTHEEEERETHSQARGTLGAVSLAAHSFLDGIAMGFAFQVSAVVGAVVTTAVLTHDFSDGINTVGMVLTHRGSRAKAFWWLLVDALTPLAGILTTFLFHASDVSLGVILAVFSGFFIYIGASELLPESHHRHPTFWTTCATALGVLVMYVAIRLAG